MNQTAYQHESTPVNQPVSTPEPQQDQPKRELFSTIAVIVLAPLVAVLLTVFVFQSYVVDGDSMETTLQNQDRLIVNKTGKTWSRITRSHFIPERYEIIVFNQNTSTLEGTGKKQLIKRIVGLPGERVVVKDGVVTVYSDGKPDGFKVDVEGPVNGKVKFTDGNVDLTVKDGEVFVLGDNRSNSLDSRVFGTIESSDIVGTLSARIFPLDHIERF